MRSKNDLIEIWMIMGSDPKGKLASSESTNEVTMNSTPWNVNLKGSPQGNLPIAMWGDIWAIYQVMWNLWMTDWINGKMFSGLVAVISQKWNKWLGDDPHCQSLSFVSSVAFSFPWLIKSYLKLWKLYRCWIPYKQLYLFIGFLIRNRIMVSCFVFGFSIRNHIGYVMNVYSVFEYKYQ